MRALITDGKGIDSLSIQEVPDPPAPAQGEALIKPKAFSLNYRDLMVAEGNYGGGLESPQIAGSDMAGEVISVGEGVANLKVGDTVLNAPIPGWRAGTLRPQDAATFLGGSGVPGVFAEKVVLPAEALVPVGTLSAEEAATIPIAGLTAWSAVITHGRLVPGGRVLCLGTGGVSVFAAQIARAMNARVIITSSSDEKLKKVNDILGAPAEGINYQKTPRFEEEVAKLTGNRGVDVVVETVGGDSLSKSVASVTNGGRVCQIGLLSGTASEVSIPHLLMRQVQLIGIFMESIAELNKFVDFLQESKVKPVIDRTFSFEESAEAYRYLKSQKHIGKVVIKM